MSSSKSQETAGDDKVADWVEAFLENSFFDLCKDHPIRRNERNRYCINCDLPVCQYCISTGIHRNHKILKIYRHVYKDVVALAAIDKYIDCTTIQPYKCNKRLVVSLNPLPHCGTMMNAAEIACHNCNRRLAEPQTYRYCCISCKVVACERIANGEVPPFVQPEPRNKGKEVAETEQPKNNKRKGTPQRAPFF